MKDFDISRRSAIQALAAGLAATKLSAADFAFTALDHVECWVASAPASAAFYSRVFGANVLKNKQTQRRYVKLGSAYLAMDQGQAVRVDHFCAGIPNFQIAALHEYLTARSIAYKDYPSDRDTAVTEPSGLKLQLAADHGWEQLLTGTAAAETIAVNAPAIFEPVGIESILLRVPDLEASIKFFGQVFGAVAISGAERWFRVGSSRIRLRQTADGQPAAVDHLRISVRKFGADATVQLQAAGATATRPISANEIGFSDPDGYQIQITSV